MGRGWFPNYYLADFEAMVLLDHSVTPDSEGYDFLMMGQPSIVKCTSPLRDVGDWAPSTRSVESHSDQSGCGGGLTLEQVPLETTPLLGTAVQPLR